MDLCCTILQVYNEVTRTFKGYSPFVLIIKYWLYSLCCTIYPCRLFAVVQLLSHVQLIATPWTAARQASRSFTIYQSLLKLMCIKSVVPSNHLILCHPLLLPPSIFPSIRVFSNKSVLCISIGVSASTSVLLRNIQSWFPLGLIGLIHCCSREFYT